MEAVMQKMHGLMSDGTTAPANGAAHGAHPFDPLTERELEQAVAIVRAAVAPQKIRFKIVEVLEPSKQAMLPYLEAELQQAKTGETVPIPASPDRRIQVQYKVLDTKGFFRATVNLTTGRVEQTEDFTGIIPGNDYGTIVEWEGMCMEHPEVKREIERLKLPAGCTVVTDPWIYGTDDADETRWLIQFYMYLSTRGDHPEANYYSCPLDFSPVFDADTGELVRIDRLALGTDEKTSDGSAAWDPVEAVEYAADLQQEKPRPDLKPYQVVQPEGPSFSVEGSLVTWQKWRFRVGFNYREGPVLYHVTYDGRSIAYRCSVSEMTVPYGDPRPPYHRKQAFDLGDVGIGVSANSLDLGCDCLGAIHYFDGVLSKADGSPLKMKHCICLHEQDAGIGWKHTNYRTQAASVTRNRQLVVQVIATVANYEYIFAWIFDQAAGLHLETRATGILSTMPIARGLTVPWGTVVGPGVLADFHQHLFSLRIDPMVDGVKNTVVYEDSVAMPLDAKTNPYGVGYVAEQTAITKAGHFETDVAKARVFKVTNPSVINPVSMKPVAYKLHVAPAQMMLMHPTSFNAKRAAFAQHPVWVTKYADKELYAAGEFTNQSKTDSGLGVWASRDDEVENEDVVLWHTYGLTHNPRPEDFPVMPVETVTVSFKPSGFFDKNPANDVPRSVQSFNKSVLVNSPHCCKE